MITFIIVWPVARVVIDNTSATHQKSKAKLPILQQAVANEKSENR